MAEINHGFATVNAFFSLLCFASYLYEERLNFCRLNSWKVKGSCRNANFACSGNFVWASEGSNIYAASNDFLYYPLNVSVTRTTPAGIAAYRSALTLDWLAAEDNRQRELASAFETESAPPARVISTDCIGYPRPAPGKIARLMLEFLKNLEGDEGVMIPELIQALIRTKLLVETSMMDAEPDFEALVHTPAVMMGEPHTTFPRILAMLWIVVTDPTTTKKYGWCSIKKVNKFLLVSKPIEIAKQMKILEPILARARFIMEEFIQNVTPLNIYEKRSTLTLQLQTIKPVTDKNKNAKRPARKHWPSACLDLELVDLEFAQEDRWVFRGAKLQDESNQPCFRVRPTTRDIVRRFYAILPYFDKQHSNTAFLHKFRGTVYGMSEGDDLLDREAAFYASVLTPIVFLQQYRDTWCLLERNGGELNTGLVASMIPLEWVFLMFLHLATAADYPRRPKRKSDDTKKSALVCIITVSPSDTSIPNFASNGEEICPETAAKPPACQPEDLHGPVTITRSTTAVEPDDDELHDKKDIKYLKELIKNLG